VIGADRRSDDSPIKKTYGSRTVDGPTTGGSETWLGRAAFHHGPKRSPLHDEAEYMRAADSSSGTGALFKADHTYYERAA
jgi:hypothetical protein